MPKETSVRRPWGKQGLQQIVAQVGTWGHGTTYIINKVVIISVSPSASQSISQTQALTLFQQRVYIGEGTLTVLTTSSGKKHNKPTPQLKKDDNPTNIALVSSSSTQFHHTIPKAFKPTSTVDT